MLALRLIYRRAGNVSLALIAFVVMAVFYLWSAQVLTFSPHGVSVLFEPLFAGAALVLAALFAILLPVLIYALRLAHASAGATGGTFLGALLGTASMTCCAPVLLPALLSLLGFSGTSILGINGLLNRYFLPLAVASAMFLLYSLVTTVQSLNLECRINLLHGNDQMS